MRPIFSEGPQVTVHTAPSCLRTGRALTIQPPAMGRTEAVQLLQQNLQEEQQMLQRVEQISQQLTQQMAAMGGMQSGQQAGASAQ